MLTTFLVTCASQQTFSFVTALDAGQAAAMFLMDKVSLVNGGAQPGDVDVWKIPETTGAGITINNSLHLGTFRALSTKTQPIKDDKIDVELEFTKAIDTAMQAKMLKWLETSIPTIAGSILSNQAFECGLARLVDERLDGLTMRAEDIEGLDDEVRDIIRRAM